ncbi:MAG: carbon-nitrogen hydrolase [Tannerella sp.]|jgi:N-carbamoylputrescine amidase|nr:carbon-nitrogen hydrolase [Tannerella sp.]
MKIGLIQQHNFADIDLNVGKLEAEIACCALKGAQIVVLQELHNTTYFCQSEDVAAFDFAETIPGNTTERFGALARKHGIVIVASMFEKRTAGLYHNTAVVIERDGSIAGVYRKMHIPDDPAYYEKFYFTPGDIGFEPLNTSVGRLGVLVCWDQWFPEAARLMALKGAEILIYPTAIGWDAADSHEEQHRQQDAWQTIQRAHAVANGIPVVAVNRVGFEPAPDSTGGVFFWGHSFVCGQQGEILYQAPDDKEDNAVVEIDLKRTETVRRWWPFLRDRRIDAYEGISERYIGCQLKSSCSTASERISGKL